MVLATALPARARLAGAAAFFLRFPRRAAAAASTFIRSAMGAVLSKASAPLARLAFRYGMVLPSFSKTASVNCTSPDRAMAPSTSSNWSRVISPWG